MYTNKSILGLVIGVIVFFIAAAFLAMVPALNKPAGDDYIVNGLGILASLIAGGAASLLFIRR